MKRVGGVALGAVVVGVALTFVSPLAFREIDFFRVRQIEVLGLQYLDYRAVLDSLELAPDRTVFHSPTEIIERGMAIPGIERVEVERRLPGTLRITFAERAPVAFEISDSGMVPLDEGGQPLPYDPLVSGMDLPLVDRADPVLIRTLAVVRSTDLALFEEAQSASIRGDSTVAIQLTDLVLLLHGVPSIERLEDIAAVRRRLDEEPRPAGEIDARFDGWVIVRGGL